MGKIWLVARHEFGLHVRKKGFLFTIFGLPLLFVLGAFLTTSFISRSADRPLGIVDESQQLIAPAQYESISENDVGLIAFSTEEEANAALGANQVQAYAVIAEDYVSSGDVTIYSKQDDAGGLFGDLRRYLRASLIALNDVPYEALFLDTVSVNERSLVGDESGFPLDFAIGIAGSMIFVFGLWGSSTYLVQAVVDEKENRTMEVLVSSIRPESLIIGKIFGHAWPFSGADRHLDCNRHRGDGLCAPRFPIKPSVLLLTRRWGCGWIVPCTVLLVKHRSRSAIQGARSLSLLLLLPWVFRQSRYRP